MRLWNCVQYMNVSNKFKFNLYLLLRTILCSFFPFLLGCIIEKILRIQLIEINIVVAGYVGVVIGMFGGIYFLMKQEFSGDYER